MRIFFNGPSFLGLTMFLIGVPSAFGHLRFGHWAGMRLPSTLKSETAWRAGHRVAGPCLIAGGLFGIVAGNYVTGAYAKRYGAWTPAVVIVEAISVIAAMILAHRAARRADPPGGSKPTKRG